MTVNENDRKNWLTKPPAKPSGRNTATVVKVLAVIAPATSRGPSGDGLQSIVAEGTVAVDVLEDDDRIVDDATDGHRQPTERQDVQRDPGELHDHERREDRQRDADRGDERRADVEQERKDREDREDRAEATLAQQPIARLEDEDRLVGDGHDLDLVRVAGRDLVELGLDVLGNGDGVGGARLADGDRDGRLAVRPAVAGRRLTQDLDRADLADVTGVGRRPGPRRGGVGAGAPLGSGAPDGIGAVTGARTPTTRFSISSIGVESADRRDRDPRLVGRQLAAGDRDVVGLEDADRLLHRDARLGHRQRDRA